MSNQVSIDQPANAGRNGLVGLPRMFGLFRTAPESRVRSLYEFLDRRFSRDVHRELLGLKSRYVNFGYWAPGCDDHDEACEALAETLGDAAGITTGDHVLDVGFGYAEQDIHWLRTRKPARIVGLNISPSQVRAARQRAAELALDDRLDLRVGSATSMPFADESFDRVVALESAVHFGTRQKFFDEAFRVLRPGGVLATADLLPRHVRPAKRSVARRLDDRMRRTLIPEHNWYPRSVYVERLAQAGFTNIDVRDVTERVLKPHAEYASQRFDTLADQLFTRRQLPSVRFYVRRAQRHAAELDYVIAVAKKPRDVQGA